MTETAAMKYPLNRAWALYAFHLETHPFCSMERATPGYVAQQQAMLSMESNTSLRRSVGNEL